MTRRGQEDAPSETPPWYADGLRFHCTVCGECCTGVPGYVWITVDDIARMADRLGISKRRFKKLYVRKAKGKLSLKELESGDCILLAEGRCCVYEAKPTRCTTFPFWSEIISSPEEWEETAKRCEGVGHGALYPLADIEKLLAGDPAPLAERQARGAPKTDEDDPDAQRRAAFLELERLYADLERELPKYDFSCAASGRCCDFDAWGHRLYVTTLEAEYFHHHLESRVNDDPRCCPAWGGDRLCYARRGRMLGCRSYFCGPYPTIPPDEIYERYHGRLKRLHERYGIPFAYRDLVDWAADLAEQ